MTIQHKKDIEAVQFIRGAMAVQYSNTFIFEDGNVVTGEPEQQSYPCGPAVFQERNGKLLVSGNYAAGSVLAFGLSNGLTFNQTLSEDIEMSALHTLIADNLTNSIAAPADSVVVDGWVREEFSFLEYSETGDVDAPNETALTVVNTTGTALKRVALPADVMSFVQDCMS